MTLTIRAAQPTDASGCLEIYAPFVTDSWVSFEEQVPTEREMKRRIDGFGYSHGWVVAELDGKTVGFAYGSPHQLREAYRMSCDVAIYVGDEYTRRGIARYLYKELFEILVGKGMHAAFAGISLPNPASEMLHRALGFTLVGIYREVGWKFDNWRDVGRWQKIL